MIKKQDVIHLRNEGKKYKEIAQILNCNISTVGYHLNYGDILKNKLKNGSLQRPKIKYGNKYKIRNREYIQNYLKTHPCVDCGNSDLRVLDFDHVRGLKVGSISNGVKDSWPLEKLQQEIDKCEIRCANCHRIVTHNRRLN